MYKFDSMNDDDLIREVKRLRIEMNSIISIEHYSNEYLDSLSDRKDELVLEFMKRKAGNSCQT